MDDTHIKVHKFTKKPIQECFVRDRINSCPVYIYISIYTQTLEQYGLTTFLHDCNNQFLDYCDHADRYSSYRYLNSLSSFVVPLLQSCSLSTSKSISALLSFIGIVIIIDCFTALHSLYRRRDPCEGKYIPNPPLLHSTEVNL